MWVFVGSDPPNEAEDIYKINFQNWQKVKNLEDKLFVSLLLSLKAFNGEIL